MRHDLFCSGFATALQQPDISPSVCLVAAISTFFMRTPRLRYSMQRCQWCKLRAAGLQHAVLQCTTAAGAVAHCHTGDNTITCGPAQFGQLGMGILQRTTQKMCLGGGVRVLVLTA